MDIPLLIRQRLIELDLDQKDLAAAAQVTESYISQLLARKKTPPAPGRSDIYEKMGQFLRLPTGELARLAEVQRQQELKKKAGERPLPLFRECRDLILRKCEPETRVEIKGIFEKDAFGELERLITQTILDTTQGLARDELRSEEWLRSMAQLSGRTFEQMRVAILEFLDTDVFSVSVEGCVVFLDPMINSWDIDLRTFGMKIVLNPRLAPGSRRRFEFVAVPDQEPVPVEPGFEQFLRDPALSGEATEEEIEFLRALKFNERRPTPLFYYRALQDLRDPLHFAAVGQARR